MGDKKITVSISYTVEEAGKEKETQNLMAPIEIGEDGTFKVGSTPAEGLQLRAMIWQLLLWSWPFHRVHAIFVRDNHEAPIYIKSNTVSTHLIVGDLAIANNDLTDIRRARIAEAEKVAAPQPGA
jgi:hypothetical protein